MFQLKLLLQIASVSPSSNVASQPNCLLVYPIESLSCVSKQENLFSFWSDCLFKYVCDYMYSVQFPNQQTIKHHPTNNLCQLVVCQIGENA